MDHRELDQIRQAGVGGRKPEQNDDKAQQQEEMKNSILSQVLTSQARERLMRINMVRPEKAQEVEGLLVKLATSGQLRSKIDEPQLVDLLSRLNQEKEQKVTFRRKYDGSDSDDDDDLSTNQPENNDDDDDDFFD